MIGSNLFFATVKRSGSVNGEAFRIANGATTSNILMFRHYLFDAEAFLVAAPSGLAETVVVQLSPNHDEDLVGNVTVAGSWFQLNDSTGAAAVKTPAAGACMVYNGIITGGYAMRLVAGVAVAADRDYFMTKMIRA